MAAGAIARGVCQDGIRVNEFAPLVEAQRAHTTLLFIEFAVGDINPAPVGRGKGNAAVWRGMPSVIKKRLPGARDNTRPESLRQADAIAIRRQQAVPDSMNQ